MNATDNKRAAVVTKTVEVDPMGIAQAVTFQFITGETLIVPLQELDPRIAAMAMAHGISQKIGDATAISRNTETGLSASAADKFAAAHEVYERLMAGEWNAVREGGGNAGGMLARALFRYFNGKQPIEALRAKVAEYTDKQRVALEQNPAIKKIIDELKAEKVDSTIDSDGLLAQLNSND